jgi:hypothetical protein
MGATFWLVNNTTREIISVGYDVFSMSIKLQKYGWKEKDYIFFGDDNGVDSVDNGRMWDYASLTWDEKNKTFIKGITRSIKSKSK